MSLKITTSLLFLVFLFSSSVVWLSKGCCPEYWMEVRDGCYRFFGTRQKWHEARDTSAHLGGSLLSVHSLEDSEAIYKIYKTLVDQPTKGENAYWLGLHDTYSEGEFQWTDESDVDFTLWRSGEPNNDGNEDCVSPRNHGDNDYERQQWNDFDCDEYKTFFCRKPLS